MIAVAVDDEVLMLGETIGNPTIKGAKVTGEIVKHGKGKKIKIFTKQKNFHFLYPFLLASFTISSCNLL